MNPNQASKPHVAVTGSIGPPPFFLQAGCGPANPYVSQHGQQSYLPIRLISAFPAGQSEIAWVATATGLKRIISMSNIV